MTASARFWALLVVPTVNAFGGLTHNTQHAMASSASSAAAIPTLLTPEQRMSVANVASDSVRARPASIEESGMSAVPLGITKTYNIYDALRPKPPPPPALPSNCCKLYALGECEECATSSPGHRAHPIAPCPDPARHTADADSLSHARVFPRRTMLTLPSRSQLHPIHMQSLL